MRQTAESNKSFFNRHVVEVARDVVGCHLYVEGVGGMIVETEAYDQNDPASHSYRGQTERNSAMFGEPGSSYLYRSYGIHWCYNIVCRPGSALLIRALEPVTGLEEMGRRRGTTHVKLLCAGPGRLCQALALDGALNGYSIWKLPFQFLQRQGKIDTHHSTRIGISRARENLWRFGCVGSEYVSRRL